MAHIVDSSVFMTVDRTSRDLDDLRRAIPLGPVAMAAITASELIVGVHRANTPDRRESRERFVEALLEAFPVLPYTLQIARIHALIQAQLMAIGGIISGNDLQIAATALVYGAGVITEDTAHFERVPGLVVIEPDW